MLKLTDNKIFKILCLTYLFCYTEPSEKKLSSSISPTELFTLMSDRDTLIIIIDVQSIEDYPESRDVLD